MIAPGSLRSFQKLVLSWVLGFMIAALPNAERLWLYPISPVWLPTGPLKRITHALCGEVPDLLLMLAAGLLFVLATWQLFGKARSWAFALMWFVFVNLMSRAWLASSGGQQLMANVLFWCAFLAARDERLKAIGFWAIRLQLLLAYAATGLHKLTGTHWLDGTAMGIAATDPAYGPAWIASFPLVATTATWAVLLFQITFPIAVWFRATRLPWMAFGALFHLATAIWMDIPEMGLAFIVCYTIWLDDDQLARLPLGRWFLRAGAQGKDAGPAAPSQRSISTADNRRAEA
jgi:hypothetical protein